MEEVDPAPEEKTRAGLVSDLFPDGVCRLQQIKFMTLQSL